MSDEIHQYLRDKAPIKAGTRVKWRLYDVAGEYTEGVVVDVAAWNAYGGFTYELKFVEMNYDGKRGYATVWMEGKYLEVSHDQS